ncbi:MAG: type IX secretion system sortase PorU [Candidatus Kapabacteria bacterium]|nr:type IX secretion system sortase PorU [Candidatus Kapabacteria bacterium]
MSLKRYLSVFITLCLCLFLSSQAFAHRYSNFVINSSTQTDLSISYFPKVLSYDTIQINNLTYKLPSIESVFIEKDNNGNPIYLYTLANLTVPSIDGFSLSNVQKYYSSENSLNTYHILKNSDGQWSAFDNFSNSQTALPDISLVYDGIARNRHIANLKIKIADINQTNFDYTIPERIDIKINFSPLPKAPIGYSVVKQQKDDFDFTLNHEIGNNWLFYPENDKFNNKKESLLALSSGTWVKINIEKEGIQRITADMLNALGYKISNSDLSTIKVFGREGESLPETVSLALENQLNEIPIIVRTKPDGSLESIIFYATAAKGFKYSNDAFISYNNYYTNTNSFLLTWGGNPGKRLQPIEPPSGEVINRPTNHIQREFYVEEFTNAFVGGSGRIWLGSNIFPLNLSPVILYNLDRSPGNNIFYRFQVAHRSTTSGTFKFFDNKREIGSIVVLGDTDKYTDGIYKVVNLISPANQISSDDRSWLSITYSNSNLTQATPFFNWYEIHYPRSLVAINNRINFFSDPTLEGITEYNFSNFSGEIIGLDVTDIKNIQQLKNLSNTGGIFNFRVNLEKNKPQQFCIASEFFVPKVEQIEFVNLRENKLNADIIVITHPTLTKSANNYKSYRESKGTYKVTVVQTNHIFNEFAYGVPDPTAIRDFIANAYANWDIKPKYVLLWGDGHYDYKNNLKLNITNFVPPYESIEPSKDYYSATLSFTSDDYFARIVGDDRRIDVSIGRLPIDSPTNGDWMVEKIKNYENNSSIDQWRTNITLVADDSPQSGTSSDGSQHTIASERLAKTIISDDFNIIKIYLPDYPTENIPNGRRRPRATEDLISTINTSGTLFLNWIGHGNPRVWAHEEIFDRDKTIPLLKNSGKYFFTTAATCDFGRYDMPDTRSGAEELVLSRIGGSIGVFSATRVVYAGWNEAINESFYKELLTRKTSTKLYPTIGEAYYNIKQYKTNDNDEKYNILADPSVKLPIPDYIITIDSLNSKYIGDNKDTVFIKALSKVSLKARILSPIDSSLVSDYNGTAFINLKDADYNVILKDIDGALHSMQKTGGALHKGTYPVINGMISAEFIIPEDISFLDGAGRINVYSYSDDNRFAIGSSRCFKVAGIDSILDVEPSKPKIEIFLDSTTFNPGDIVSNNPILIVNLYDDYGINTTGNGIGHGIEAWIDDNPKSIDLTNQYTTTIGKTKFGTARTQLFNLSPGVHTVRVRAWNVFNKFSIAETFFRIGGNKDGIIIGDVYPYPNPFSDNVTIRFRHNISEPFNAELKFFNTAGMLVQTIQSEISSIHTSEIHWNGRDNNGALVTAGAYIYQLTLTDKKGNTSSKYGILMNLK